MFAHVIDASFHSVLVRNATQKPISIPARTKLGKLYDYNADGCYLADPSNAHLAANSSWKQPKRYEFGAGNMSGAGPPLNSLMERQDATGITAWGQPDKQAALFKAASSYPELWKDYSSTVNVPPQDWMTVKIKPGARINAPKIFSLGPKDKHEVDAMFDKLHQQGKMEWSSKPTPHGSPVFVVRKTVCLPGKPPHRKARVVVDICGLNKIAEDDCYSMSLQTDITSAVAGAKFITTVDATSFFYQFLVSEQDRDKFTVVSHRGQEYFKVAVMGFKNSPAYVQRRIDIILRPFWEFARAYIDNIVIFSTTFEEHVAHLHRVFTFFQSIGMRLNPKRSYFGYPLVQLLGQRVTGLGPVKKRLRLLLS